MPTNYLFLLLKQRVALSLLQLLVQLKSHLPHFSFLCVNDGDGTKCSDSTDYALAYDDDELRVRRVI